MYKIYSLNKDIKEGIFINLRNLEVNHYGELLPLNEYLKKCIDDEKLIIINVVPIDNTANDILGINKENTEYVEKLFNTISNYKSLNIKVCSTSIRILNTLNNYFIHTNCGYYVSEDLNYPDCKFYVFPEKKYSIKKTDNEIKNDKIVFILINEESYNQIKNEIRNEIRDTSNIYLIKKTL